MNFYLRYPLDDNFKIGGLNFIVKNWEVEYPSSRGSFQKDRVAINEPLGGQKEKDSHHFQLNFWVKDLKEYKIIEGTVLLGQGYSVKITNNGDSFYFVTITKGHWYHKRYGYVISRWCTW